MMNSFLEDFCRRQAIRFFNNASMDRYTSLGIGGPADYVLFPRRHDIGPLVALLHNAEIPCMAIGYGTNLLVRDGGIEGAVLLIREMTGYTIGKADCPVEITCDAGFPLKGLIRLSLTHGLTGCEGLAGIPGSVGGAVSGNAGSYGHTIGDIVKEIEIIRPDGTRQMISNRDLGFGYRRAAIPHESVIVSVTVRLGKDDPEKVRKKIRDCMAEKRSRHPLAGPSAGCVFRNVVSEGMTFPAGLLIDEAGCKGMREGGIMVSSRHANYFVRTEPATARHFLDLMERVRDRVEKKSGLILESEIRIVGREKESTG